MDAAVAKSTNASLKPSVAKQSNTGAGRGSNVRNSSSAAAAEAAISHIDTNISPSRYPTRRSGVNVSTPTRSAARTAVPTPSSPPTQQTTTKTTLVLTPTTTPTRRPRGRPSKGSTPTKDPISSPPPKIKTITPPSSASRTKPSAKRPRINKSSVTNPTTTTTSAQLPESTMQPLIRAALERRMVANAVMHISFYRWCRLYFQNNLSTPDQILPHELEDTPAIDGDDQTRSLQSKWFAATANGEKVLAPLQIMREAVTLANQRRAHGDSSESTSMNGSDVSTTTTTTTRAIHNNDPQQSESQESNAMDLVLLSNNNNNNNNALNTTRPPEILLEEHLQYWRSLKQCWNEKYAARSSHYQSKLKSIFGADVFT